jgi:hypothetical protein
MKVFYNEQYNFNHLQAEEDMVITDFVVGSDILKYSSFKQAYCPVNADLSRYYEITDEEDAEYKELQDIAIKTRNSNED